MRQMVQSARDKVLAFRSDRRGNFAVLTAAVASVLALSAGFAVDVVQLYNVKWSLQNALDAAITSTARDLTTGAIKPEDARKRFEAFFFANGDADFAGSEQIVLGDLVVDRTARTVSASAYVDAALFFPVFRSGSAQRVGVESAALYSDKAVEVAMMLDITGSMKGQKIDDLKSAATNAVNALLGNQDEKSPRVRVAIVPYAEAVNTGGLSDTVFVETRGGANLPPPDDAAVLASAASAPDKCATERKNPDGSADFSDDSPYSSRFYLDTSGARKGKSYLARINRDDRITAGTDWYGRKYTKCPKAEIIPLTAKKQKLLDTIDDFEADGVTSGGIAAQWGYYMLSPDWHDAIADAGLGSGPANYNPKKISKVAILMTDGQFNTAFAGVKDGDSLQGAQGAKSRSYAESLCENMKRDGIEIFTIGFALDDPDVSTSERREAKAVLKDCSTKDTGSIKHFYEASTGTELDGAFRSIVGNIERLAVTR